jgi:hypothetical protein
MPNPQLEDHLLLAFRHPLSSIITTQLIWRPILSTTSWVYAITWWQEIHLLYKEGFHCVERVYGSALHGGRCAACCETHTNFDDESASLRAVTFGMKGRNKRVGRLTVLCYTASSVRICSWFVSSRQQLSTPLAICSQLQLVRSVVRHDSVYFRATCISACHQCEIWIC